MSKKDNKEKQERYQLPCSPKTTPSLPLYLVACALDINPETKQSEWWELSALTKKVGFDVGSEGKTNGNTFFQNDRAIGNFYTFEKIYEYGNTGKLLQVKITGLSTTSHKKQTSFSSSVIDKLKKMRCAHCNKSGADSKAIEIDHKVVRDPKPKGTLTLADGQALCKSCNILKTRSGCTPCKETNQRFNAKKELGFEHPFLVGGNTYSGAHEGCYGCYWHDCNNFKSKVSKLFVPFSNLQALLNANKKPKGPVPWKLQGKWQEVPTPDWVKNLGARSEK